MQIYYDKTKIQNSLYNFTEATNINATFIKNDFTALISPVFEPIISQKYCRNIQALKNGHCKCIASDKELFLKCAKSRKTEVHVCHAGLVDIAVPIILEENIVGFLLLGQMKDNKPFCEIEKLTKDLNPNLSELEELYKQLPVFEPKKIDSIVNVAEILAKYLLLENSLFSTYGFSVASATDYINNNLQNHLTVEKISRKSGVSKNTLYREFKKEFNMSVFEYIIKKRIEKAESLLLKTNLSVEEIAVQTGFSTSSYFGSVFKKEKGVSPLKYRKAK